MHRRRAVGDADHRDGQAEQPLQYGQSFSADLFPDQGFEDLAKAVAIDAVHERVAGAGQDQRLVVGVEGDLFQSLG